MLARGGLAVVLDSSRGGLASTLLESKVRTIFGRRTKIMPNQLPRVAHDEPMMVGDHPALEILNTAARVDGELVDSLPSDRDVLLWLSRVGWPAENDLAHFRADALLKSARALRATIRVLIEKRKAGKRSDPRALNVFLAHARSHLELVSNRGESLDLKRQWERHTPEQILAPIAESAAHLLARGDFSLVRRCENGACVLWFYDRTRSHHRRWRSMATCGNRYKVAAFRKRQRST
jgi:predicted RNA-binding Zn ribbon-like protein